jgi:hypothetical protein
MTITCTCKSSDAVFADYFSLQEQFHSSHADEPQISDVRMACLSVTYRPGCHKRYLADEAASDRHEHGGLTLDTAVSTVSQV